ncbi:YhdH/YhfP family quinone oxidoreductase [Emticicia sp. BO119]|uniref:YhdH/YhfP family quinone oxidoreductase n=1 Tax=Emticicia sp. BO119 TaxID=2757768 RepID=UPI0015F11C24|nr:YhdH/YhfP family quinone oxidoreductase [Emticicia sp. BO119]MBA4852605.1 YhdH/YhfP family quinone oxidoreductase [Emticicia sp. BO119]
MPTFQAFYVSENEDKTFSRQIIERSTDDLPAGEVLIRVKYSSLNYKDALSSSGNRGVTRNYPHTPGIDAAGIVEESNSDELSVGEQVIVTGFDLGMNTAGGFGQYIRVPAKWVVKLPRGLRLKESMIFGTAGLTAALCIDKLLQTGLTPDKGKVIVTGATGGVGTMAVMILAKLGFAVVGVTGKPEGEAFLLNLGAKEVVSREAVNDQSGKPMLKGIYAGCVDTVGGNILATILKSMQYNGVVSLCGLVQSPELPTTVFPFILRGVSMFGIDSSECDIEWRKKMWKNLAKKWKPEGIQSITRTVGLKGLDKEIRKILKGGQMGRVVVRL